MIEASDDSLPVTAEWLSELFEADAVQALLGARGDSPQLIQWWSRRIAPAFHGRVQFPTGVALGGKAALEESSRVIVGTIHSVKGGQADVVFLFPDLSPAGDAAYHRGTERKETP